MNSLSYRLKLCGGSDKMQIEFQLSFTRDVGRLTVVLFAKHVQPRSHLVVFLSGDLELSSPAVPTDHENPPSIWGERNFEFFIMAGKLEALNSETLTPCVTLMIFSFMVSFTISILALALKISVLHLPVLVMWMITVFFALLTAVYWYCDRFSSKSVTAKSFFRFGHRNTKPERRALSKNNEGSSDQETGSYGTDGKAEPANELNEK